MSERYYHGATIRSLLPGDLIAQWINFANFSLAINCEIDQIAQHIWDLNSISINDEIEM